MRDCKRDREEDTNPPDDPTSRKQELGGGLPLLRWAWAAGFAMVREVWPAMEVQVGQ